MALKLAVADRAENRTINEGKPMGLYRSSGEYKTHQSSNDKARAGWLGWTPKSPKEAILATAQSLTELGL